MAAPLDYSPSAPDNPLKGLVPYASASGKAQFPYSMEFSYFSLKDVMKGPNEFDWQVIKTGWKLSGLLPGKSRTWSTALSKKGSFKIRVPNPMKGGKPLRFANRNQSEEWLTIKP